MNFARNKKKILESSRLTSFDDNRKNVGGNGSNIGGSHRFEPDALVGSADAFVRLLILTLGDAPPLASDRRKLVNEPVGANKSGIKLQRQNTKAITLNSRGGVTDT